MSSPVSLDFQGGDLWGNPNFSEPRFPYLSLEVAFSDSLKELLLGLNITS